MSKIEIMRLTIEIDQSIDLNTEGAQAHLVLFHGTAQSDYFQGVILPGGVDTQTQWGENPYCLSARYMIDGTDYTGKQCRIFVENNGVFEEGEFRTKPVMMTDSEALAFLQELPMRGRVETIDDQLTILIDADQEENILPIIR